MEDLVITFSTEPEDRSVGIMGPSFSAWDNKGQSWCELESYKATIDLSKFSWYDNESGSLCAAPRNSRLVEAALHAYVSALHEMEQEYVLPNGHVQGSPEDQAAWWNCIVCGFKGPFVGTRPDGKKGCLGSCGGRTPNPNSTGQARAK